MSFIHISYIYSPDVFLVNLQRKVKWVSLMFQVKKTCVDHVKLLSICFRILVLPYMHKLFWWRTGDACHSSSVSPAVKKPETFFCFCNFSSFFPLQDDGAHAATPLSLALTGGHRRQGGSSGGLIHGAGSGGSVGQPRNLRIARMLVRRGANVNLRIPDRDMVRV